MEESVLTLKDKTTHHWFSYVRIAHKYYISCMPNP